MRLSHEEVGAVAELVLRSIVTKDQLDKKWYVYMIECKDSKIYTGITDNLDRRVKQHNRGCGSRFTKYRKPVELRYSEEHDSRSQALKREIQIKGLTREKKLELISNN